MHRKQVEMSQEKFPYKPRARTCFTVQSGDIVRVPHDFESNRLALQLQCIVSYTSNFQN